MQLAVKMELRKMGSSLISMASLAKMGEGPDQKAGLNDEGVAEKKKVSEKVRYCWLLSIILH